MDNGLTIKQVAERTNVSPVTIRKYCRNGIVFPNAKKLNYNGWTIWLIPESDLVDYELRIPATGRPPSHKERHGEYNIYVADKLLKTYKSSPLGMRQCQQGYDAAIDMFKDNDGVTVRVMNNGQDVTFLFSGNGSER